MFRSSFRVLCKLWNMGVALEEDLATQEPELLATRELGLLVTRGLGLLGLQLPLATRGGFLGGGFSGVE